MTTARWVRSNESGFMLVQVVAMSAILLLMVFAAMKTVRTSIQLSNTTASSFAFQDLRLEIEQNLSNTELCRARLFTVLPSGVTVLNLITDASAKYPTTIAGPAGVIIAEVETAGKPQVHPEFKITEINLERFRPLGRRDLDLHGKQPQTELGTQPWQNWLGQLSVVAERRANFLGSATLRMDIPVLLQVQPGTNTIFGCSTRKAYTLEIGPPVLPDPAIKRKSALECLDRGGYPVVEAGNTYYTCAIPRSSQINSARMLNNVRGANVYSEGWYTTSPPNSPVIYAY